MLLNTKAHFDMNITEQHPRLFFVKTQGERKPVLFKAEVYFNRKGWQVKFDHDADGEEHFEGMVIDSPRHAEVELNELGYALISVEKASNLSASYKFSFFMAELKELLVKHKATIEANAGADFIQQDCWVEDFTIKIEGEEMEVPLHDLDYELLSIKPQSNV